MVIALNSGADCPGSSTDQGHYVVFLHFMLCLSLHPGVGMGTGKCNVEGNPAVDHASHPGGSRNTPSRFMLQKPG